MCSSESTQSAPTAGSQADESPEKRSSEPPAVQVKGRGEIRQGGERGVAARVVAERRAADRLQVGVGAQVDREVLVEGSACVAVDRQEIGGVVVLEKGVPAAVQPVGVLGAQPGCREARGLQRIIREAQRPGEKRIRFTLCGGVFGVGAVKAARAEFAPGEGGDEVALQGVARGTDARTGRGARQIIVALAVGLVSAVERKERRDAGRSAAVERAGLGGQHVAEEDTFAARAGRDRALALTEGGKI